MALLNLLSITINATFGEIFPESSNIWKSLPLTHQYIFSPSAIIQDTNAEWTSCHSRKPWNSGELSKLVQSGKHLEFVRKQRNRLGQTNVENISTDNVYIPLLEGCLHA